MIDPRVCRTPPPWDHLSLAEVDETKRLWRKLVGDGLEERGHQRLAYLSKRRVRPQYETVQGSAA